MFHHVSPDYVSYLAGSLLAAIPHHPNAYGAIFGVGPVPTENSIMATHDRGLTTAVAIPSAKHIS